jgi:hypothetical protein
VASKQPTDQRKEREKKRKKMKGDDDEAVINHGKDGGRGRLDPSSSTVVALGAAAGTIALLSVLLTVREKNDKRQIRLG